MEERKEERVHRVFENISTRYDKMNSIISFQQHKLWRRDVMKRMDVAKGSHALDVCCGTGDWTMAMGNAVGNSGHVIGVDFSYNMLAEAVKKKIEQPHFINIEYQHGNAMALPFEDNTFDYVTVGFGLRNVPDYFQALSEMYRVLKPGGTVVCLETSQPENPVFKNVYYTYFEKVMPLLGKWFAESFKEYQWLNESAKSFPGKIELKRLFEDAGFSDVEMKSYSAGVAAMHMGRK
ncbi:bifunctional demethylmenaquinone methyltransferase/2-methoxy-6-polyprenyl-1,4-benzoquinol methylase [Salimicrobium jeotgali]|uniref:Demethylmenaquinone methyltransferase n=2 Tax=Salimicrobium TaxID=351195 RepID=K2GQE2_9BACI|nr:MULTISPECIES: demethylmenaquinone methyltransferase [Salimicrobium]AKG04406.1 bifunctional demethylmenaquinone methyltransferase/2-methoxy-6-polyprenyl-1,4-benzoquinol methylase [Salimicrobium jeotgali]EKE32599.1 ubiquinone/menaquinone biosynthesis methyltransferase [Salimicrobium jeotgali]MBM7695418.1 demethylmenaquinone methyltransferase/2-methoxy-6-polyprenyl-1,4-benzoquinol methylase [Salimicrobium jeotgali]SIS55939.1 2-octaprenyl-6-methoxy-1,4-benzoquinone methylase /demethylmenaquinone